MTVKGKIRYVFPRSATDIAVAAIMIAVTAVLQNIVRVPVPATKGIINLTTAGTFMSALLFGPYIGVIGGGLGSGIGAVLGGYPYWFVPTTVIESVNALTCGFIGHGRGKPMMILACLVGGFCFWMGYFLVEIPWFGLGPALIELPLNVVQWMVCLVIAIAVVTVVQRAYPPVKYWAVKRTES